MVFKIFWRLVDGKIKSKFLLASMKLHIPIVKNFSNLLQRPYTENKSWTEILMRLPEQYLELVSVFKKAKRDFIHIFSWTRQAKNLKTICACTESTDLIL
jgi:hypothetical protein